MNNDIMPDNSTENGEMTEPIQIQPPQDQAPELTGEGKLQVRVFTADGAIPLEYATVVIRDTAEAGGGVIVSFISDRNGLTPTISLPAPSRTLSQTPGGAKPYSSYNIDVILPGYYTPIYEGVPIFDGITSVQNAIMIPIPENGFSDGYRPDMTNVFPESVNPELDMS